MAAKVVTWGSRDTTPAHSAPARPRRGSQATPGVLRVEKAGDEIHAVVSRVRRGRWIVLGGRRHTAMLALQPPKAKPTPEPTIILDVDIDKLFDEYDDICEEVRTSGAAYRILVNGTHAAWLCPTALAWETKIARTRANLAGPLIQQVREDVRHLAQRLDEFEDRAVHRDKRLQRILGFAEQWLREWRKAQGLPSELPPEPESKS